MNNELDGHVTHLENLLRRCLSYVEPEAKMWTDTEELAAQIKAVLGEE